MPLGLPVVPDVYSRKRRSSLSIDSGSHVASASASSSWYQWSRPSVMSMSASPPEALMRSTTTTCSTDGVLASATSTVGLRRPGLPRRQPPSAVMTTLHSASLMRSASESALKPPNTTEWAAPMRAQASSAAGSSGIIGM